MQRFSISYCALFLPQKIINIIFNHKPYHMGCTCFYAEKLQKYKDLYPVSTKLASEDPRLNDPQFLKEQIKKLDFIIKHQNQDLAKLQHENDKLQKHPRNRKKVLNNAKKLFLLSKNGYLCKYCIEQNDTNKMSVEQMVNIKGLCGKCKGDGLMREYLRVKDKRCGKCDRFYEYLWKIQTCSVCNGVGVLYTQGLNPYGHEQEGGGTNQQLAKKY